MTGFYRSYIERFAKTCEPLYKLTRLEEKFKWENSEVKAFEIIKTALSNAPILSHPNFDHPFIIETDARLKGLGAVLIQRFGGGKFPPLGKRMLFNTLVELCNQLNANGTFVNLKN